MIYMVKELQYLQVTEERILGHTVILKLRITVLTMKKFPFAYFPFKIYYDLYPLYGGM